MPSIRTTSTSTNGVDGSCESDRSHIPALTLALGSSRLSLLQLVKLGGSDNPINTLTRERMDGGSGRFYQILASCIVVFLKLIGFLLKQLDGRELRPGKFAIEWRLKGVFKKQTFLREDGAFTRPKK